MNLCSAYVHVYDLQIDSPSGFTQPYILKCGEVILNLGMWSMLKSLSGQVVVEDVLLRDMHIVIENRNLISSESNVHVVLKYG